MKQIKGVISHWTYDGVTVSGVCEFHVDQLSELSLSAIISDRIVKSHVLRTSRVLAIEHCAGYAICETQNSLYLLVNKETRC